MKEKTEHHSESPSHYNAWVHCIHWRSAEHETSEANAGTHNHKELEKGLADIEYEPDTYVARWANEWVHCECGDTCTLCSEKRLVGTYPGLEGVYGTTDVYWMDGDGCKHFADLKTFSDGSEDYSWQLKGYAALDSTIEDTEHSDKKVYLHILHGGICKVETVESTVGECLNDTLSLLSRVRSGTEPEKINKYCQYCSRIKECPMANQAVQVVNGNGQVDFSKMSLPQKLVICETVEKLIKALKDDAKQQAIANGGVLEADGIRYEIKERAGKGRVRDLCDVAGAMECPPEGYVGLSRDSLLSICELPKTALVNAVKAANAENKSVKKKDLEVWCASFYDKGEPMQVLSRVK